jgi:hypothetical protein
MKLTPSIVSATWTLVMITLEQAGSGEEFARLPPDAQAHMLASPVIRSYLLNIVGEVLQSEADRLAGQ